MDDPTEKRAQAGRSRPRERIARAGAGAMTFAAMVLAATGARPAQAADAPASGAGLPSTLPMDPSLALNPAAPQIGALPGGVTPAFGQKSLSEDEWRFDFHGFITAPMNASFGKRSAPIAGQSSTTLHAPPVVPDDLETFSHTGVVPTTYAQINFSEGNSVITGLVSVVAKQANVSTSFLEPASQLGITDVFLSITPPINNPRLHLQAFIGAFTTRFGATA